jgi:FtsZ-binding cell division protein ZapB
MMKTLEETEQGKASDSIGSGVESGALLSPATSEERFGIVAQPQPTCPMVDAALDALKDAESRLKGWDRMELEELKEAADYAEWYIDRAKDELENVRQSNMDLRNWGEEWKREAKSLGDNSLLQPPVA